MTRDYARAALILCTTANVLLWAAASYGQISEGAGALERLIGIDPSLGFAGLVIAFVLLFVASGERGHRQERVEWANALRETAKSNLALAEREGQLIATIQQLESTLSRLTSIEENRS